MKTNYPLLMFGSMKTKLFSVSGFVKFKLCGMSFDSILFQQHPMNIPYTGVEVWCHRCVYCLDNTKQEGELNYNEHFEIN